MNKVCCLVLLFCSLKGVGQESFSSVSHQMRLQDDIPTTVLKYGIWMTQLYELYMQNPNPVILQNEVSTVGDFVNFFEMNKGAIRQDCLNNGWPDATIEETLNSMETSCNLFLQTQTQDQFLVVIENISALIFYLRT